MSQPNLNSFKLDVQPIQHTVPKSWYLHSELGNLVIEKLQELLKKDAKLETYGVIAGQAVCSIVMELAGYPRGPIKDIDIFFVRQGIKANHIEHDKRIKSLWYDDSEIDTQTLDKYPLLKFHKKVDPAINQELKRNQESYLLFGKPLEKNRSCSFSVPQGKIHQNYLGSLNLYQIYACDQKDLINYVYCKTHEKTRFKIKDLLSTFDINCTQVAVDLKTKELIWTEAFEEFIHSFELKVHNTSQPAHTVIRWVEKRKSMRAYGDDYTILSLLALSIDYGELFHTRDLSSSNHMVYPHEQSSMFFGRTNPRESFHYWQKARSNAHQQFNLMLGPQYQKRFLAIQSELSDWFDLDIIDQIEYKRRFPKSYQKKLRQDKNFNTNLAILKCKMEPDASLQQSLLKHVSGKGEYGVLMEFSALPQFLYWSHFRKMTHAQHTHLNKLKSYQKDFPTIIPILLAQLYSTGIHIMSMDFSKKDLVSIRSCYRKHPQACHKLLHLPIRKQADILRYIKKMSKVYGEEMWGFIENETELFHIETIEDIHQVIKNSYVELLRIEIKNLMNIPALKIDLQPFVSDQLYQQIPSAKHVDTHDKEVIYLTHCIQLLKHHLSLEEVITCYQKFSEQLSHTTQTHYRIDQLLVQELKTAKELRSEGRRMKNCVGGYALAVAQKKSWIFSMKSIQYEINEEYLELPYDESFQSFHMKCPTYEVSNVELKRSPANKQEKKIGFNYIYTIVQHKGISNREPHSYHQYVAKKFAQELTLLQLTEDQRDTARSTWKQYLHQATLSKIQKTKRPSHKSLQNSIYQAIKSSQKTLLDSLNQYLHQQKKSLDLQLTETLTHLPVPKHPRKKSYWFKSQRLMTRWLRSIDP